MAESNHVDAPTRIELWVMMLSETEREIPDLQDIGNRLGLGATPDNREDLLRQIRDGIQRMPQPRTPEYEWFITRKYGIGTASLRKRFAKPSGGRWIPVAALEEFIRRCVHTRVNCVTRPIRGDIS